MTALSTGGRSVGDAWRAAAQAVLAVGGSTFHLVVRIGADADDPAVEARVDELLLHQGNAPIRTVANTIFPEQLGRRYPEPHDLSSSYLALYPRLRRFPANRYGTYFGRLVDHPGGGEHANQLVDVVKKLRAELASSTNRSSRYECAIYNPAKDAGKTGSFPCLSNVAFHLDSHGGRLHVLATYRNQYLVQRAYGNYLGLTGLRDYVAQATDLQPGELLVVAGHAVVDGGKPALRDALADLEALKGPPSWS